MSLVNRLYQLTVPIRERLPAGVRVQLAGKKLHWNGEPEAKLLNRFVEVGTTAIDVGSNVGNYSYLLAKLVGRNGQVISVEPLAENARWLIEGAPKLRLPIEVHVTALSSRQGVAAMQIPLINGQPAWGMAGIDVAEGEGESREVQVTTLEELSSHARSRISFIKIDTEGHEKEVVEGGLATLREHRPNLLIEIEQRHHQDSIRGIFDYIVSLGYTGLFLDSKGLLRLIDTFDLQEHQLGPLGTSDGFYSRHYLNNFFFLPVTNPAR